MIADDDPYNDRIYRPRINFNLPSTCFREAFRVDPPVIEIVERRIGIYIQRRTMRSHALSVREQILITLHFLGNGSYYHVNGHMHGIDKITVCRCVHTVCLLITSHLMPTYVRWPDQQRFVERLFFQKARFPHVYGVVDGTLVHIRAPSADEPAFVGRDNRHSINTLVVCGPKYEFYFASAKCVGSVHDSRCLRVSNLWRKWELDG